MAKKSPPRKRQTASEPKPVLLKEKVSQKLNYIKLVSADYLSRRPHRSFRRTRRRDYVRSLSLPGYIAFTIYVFTVVWRSKKLFIGLVLFYAVLGAAFVGLSSQSSYEQLSQLLDETGADVFSGGWGAVGQAGLLLLSGLSGSVAPELSDVQQVYAGIILLLTWLTTVWLLRALLAGKRPRLRDGVYNAGGPIVATGIVLLVLLIQLLPATIGIIVLNSAISTDLFKSGFIAMVISLSVVLLVILSLYWVVSTVIALIIATLPGMYPWQAIRSAGDVVIGRRVRILLRILWLMLGNAFAYIVIVLPVILLDRFIKEAIPAVQAVPFVPVVIALVSSVVVVWSASYLYLLYRKVVEDDASPA